MPEVYINILILGDMSLFQVVYAEVNFPAVSMCNLNALRESMLPYGGPNLQKQIDEISDQLAEQLSGEWGLALTSIHPFIKSLIHSLSH